MADPTATGPNPNYPITISDGTNKVGIQVPERSVANIRRLPRGPGVERKSAKQQDWSSGRGNSLFSKDQARFFDSGALWSTVPNQICNGPLAKFGRGHRTADSFMPGREWGGSGVSWVALITNKYLARSFVAGASYDADRAYLYIRKVGSPGNLTFELCSDNSGKPGTVLKTVTDGGGQVTDWLSVLVKFDWDTTQSLVSGTTYWLKVYDSGSPTTLSHWEVGCLSSSAGTNLLLTNPGFETGSLSGWTGTGPGQLLSGGAHSGTYYNQRYRDTAWGPGISSIKTAGANAAVVSGDTYYTVSGWVAWGFFQTGGTVAATDSLKVEWYSGSEGGGSLLRTDIIWSNSYNTSASSGGSSSWEYKAATLLSPTGALSALIIAELNVTNAGTNAAQQLSIDDASISLPSYTGKYSTAGASWFTTYNALYYRVTDAEPSWVQTLHFFEYKRQLYYCTSPETGGTPALAMNGDRGVATGTQAVTNLTDTTKSWTANEWTGCVVLIYKGVNKGLARKISSNTATALTLEESWPTACTTGASGSEYVILGSNKWTAISAGLTAPVTSVAVFNDIIYMACGEGTNIRRTRQYNNAGVWTNTDNADDGTNKANHLLTWPDSTGVVKLYRALNSDSTFSKASAVAWGTNLTFGTSVVVGTTESNITGMTGYNNKLWIAKEDSLWAVSTSDIAAEANVPLKPGRDGNNGVNLRMWNSNLYFPFLNGFERLYDTTLTTVDDIGPNRDEGLPSTRRGKVYNFLPILNHGYITYDAGPSGYSSVLLTTPPGGGWHEIFRAPEAGKRIRGLFYQSIPLLPNRLWMLVGHELVWLTMPDDTYTPLNDPLMEYTHESYVVSSWLDFESPELDHFYDELRLFSLNLNGSGQKVEVDYQVDDVSEASPWLRFNTDFTASPYQKSAFNDGTVTGRRARYRLRLLTDDVTEPVVIKTAEVRGDTMNEVLYDYVVDITVSDKLMLLSGGDATSTALAALTQLQSWQEDATILTMRSVIPAFDNVVGHIDPLALQPSSWDPKETKLKGSLTFKGD